MALFLLMRLVNEQLIIPSSWPPIHVVFHSAMWNYMFRWPAGILLRHHYGGHCRLDTYIHLYPSPAGYGASLASFYLCIFVPICFIFFAIRLLRKHMQMRTNI